MYASIVRRFSSPPFKVLGVNKISIANSDRQFTNDFWCRILGLPKVSSIVSKV
jgi:hypothetical protein